MTVIHVPRPPKSAFDPSRPVSALLRAQMEYMQAAETKLPSRYRSEVYVNAIRTEGEAAQYIRTVTEAIHDAHAEAAARRSRPLPRRKPRPGTAAVADPRAKRKSGGASKKRAGGKPGTKKSGAKKSSRKRARKT